MAIKHERRRLDSRHRDGTLMYPGEWIFTWIKPIGFPWMLMSITPAGEAG